MSSADKIKVLVLGDCGVGKSCLVHLICHHNTIGTVNWTIGATIDVKVHEFNEGTPNQKSYPIELWDIGGYKTHSCARSIFYNSFHGIILVHDLTNRKSHQNLRKWLAEVFYAKDSCGKDVSTSSYFDDYNFDVELFAERNIPILVVGTKLDLIQTPSRRARVSSVAEECGAEEIQLNCHEPKSFAAASTNSVKLSRFFDKVVERKYNAHSGLVPLDRTKKHATNLLLSNKSVHLD